MAVNDFPFPSGRGTAPAALGCLCESHYVCRRISCLAQPSFIPQVPYPPLRGTFPLRGRLNRCAKAPHSFLIRAVLSPTIKGRHVPPVNPNPWLPIPHHQALPIAHLLCYNEMQITSAMAEKRGTQMGKQILLVNDLPGYGKVALAAMMPVLARRCRRS